MQKKLARWGFSLVHAIWLLGLTFYWLAQPITYPDEAFLRDWSAVINKTILKLKANRPPSEAFLFINVSTDKLAIEDEFGVRRIITDRSRLGKLMKLLNSRPNSYRYILCDVLFDHPSEQDSLFRAEVEQMNRIIVPNSVVSDTANQNKLILPIFKVKSGLVDYEVTARKGVFSKYTLMEFDTLKSLPLLMYEDLHQKKMTKQGIFSWMNNQLSYNTIAPDLRIRNYDLFEGRDYTSIPLFELLILLESENKEKIFEQFIQNRILVIGDFDNDKARTVFGDLAGSLILVNVYLALLNQDNLVSYGMLCFLLLTYWLISYSLFYSFRTNKEFFFFRIRKNRIVLFFDYLIALILISFVCYALSGIHLNVALLFIYLKAVDYVRNQTLLEKTRKELLAAYKRSDELLLNILPQKVAEELKKNNKTTVESYKLVTVLFTDFKSFTDYASTMEPAEVVKQLDYYFSKFDEIMEKYQLEKIKTIGDAYMAAGGIPSPNLTNPLQAVLASLEIQALMKKIKQEKEQKGEGFWEIRIGINSGELIAGVIGTKKFAYDVWGDTVNIASRMETNSEAGKINISDNTYQLVKEFILCEYRGEISIKGKGKMDAYFVQRIKPEYSTDVEGYFPNQALILKIIHLSNTSKISLSATSTLNPPQAKS